MKLSPIAAYCLLAVTVGSIGSFAALRIYQRQKASRAAAAEFAKNPGAGYNGAAAIAWWAGRSFSEITPLSAHAIAEQIKVDPPAVPVTEEMISQARQRALDFMLAYSTGLYSDYRKFILPSGVSGTLDPAILAYKRSKLLKFQVCTTGDIPTDSDAIVQLDWERGDGRTPPNASQFDGYLKGVALGESSIAFSRESRYPDDMEFALRSIKDRRSAGYAGYRRSVEYSTSPEKIVTSARSIQLMEIHLVISTKKPDYPHAISLWYYWAPAEKTWLPGAFVELTNYNRRVLLSF